LTANPTPKTRTRARRESKRKATQRRRRRLCELAALAHIRRRLHAIRKIGILGQRAVGVGQFRFVANQIGGADVGGVRGKVGQEVGGCGLSSQHVGRVNHKRQWQVGSETAIDKYTCRGKQKTVEMAHIVFRF
jgi:hypothetical protein